MLTQLTKILRKIRRMIDQHNPKNQVPRRKMTVNGILLDITDHPTSIVRDEVKECLNEDVYGIELIDFKKGDVVIDIGANVGIVSIYLAKKFPDIKIFSYEPIPTNYANLLKNIENNTIANIQPFNLAITHDRRNLDMLVHSASNSGGATACLENMNLEGHDFYKIHSITLDDIFLENNIESCRLLKIDVEGSEHEILLNSKVLNRIEYLGAEFHINGRLKNQGYSNQRLKDHCSAFFASEKMNVQQIQLAE